MNQPVPGVPLEPVRIWLNRNYATTVHLWDMLRHNPDDTPVRLFGSHPDFTSPMLVGCDFRLPESPVTDDDFVERMLDLCTRHEIDVLLPVAGQSSIAHRAAEFRAVAGTSLICPPAAAIDTLADKGLTYTSLGGSALIPPWRVVSSLDEFDAAIADLDQWWTDSAPLIVKPARGAGADGVRFLTRRNSSLQSLLGPVGPAVALEVMREALGAAESAGAPIPALMVMPYLAGPETSVDVLASGGRTLAAIPRAKSGRHRVIGGDPALPGLAAELVQHFELDGLVNVQFRYFESRPALLEINARPAGGLYQTALAGVNLPWAAVLLALGRPMQPLRPRLGAEFVTVSSMVPLASPVPAAPWEPMVSTGPAC